MKSTFVLSLLILFIGCQKSNNTLIAKNQLGNINQNTEVHQIESVMPQDSVVIGKSNNTFGYTEQSTEIRVYDTLGIQLLNIKPLSADTISTIRSIRVLTEKYKTKNGIGLGSTYDELRKYHDFNNIQSLSNSIIITLKEINAIVSFDRNVLPGDVRYDIDAEIKPTMIAGEGKINRFWINFEQESDGRQ